MPPHYSEIVERLFDGEHFKSLLDVGCGPLQYLDVIRRISPDVRLAGFDSDEGVIAVAQERLGAAGLKKSKAILHDVHVEPWPFIGKYDVVCLIAVLLILSEEDSDIVMRNVRERCGRRLLILDMHDPSVRIRDERPRDFIPFLEKYGFKDIEIIPVSGWPSVRVTGHIIKANV